jgi:chemotaxis protein CheX
VCRLTEIFSLPPRLDSSGVMSLRDALLARRGQPVCLDAAQVEVIGALAIETIVSAARQWAADNQRLTLASPSPRFCAVCDLLGVHHEAPWLPRLSAPIAEKVLQ